MARKGGVGIGRSEKVGEAVGVGTTATVTGNVAQAVLEEDLKTTIYTLTGRKGRSDRPRDSLG